MMVVADTHAWVWWVHDRTKLTARARAALERASRVGVAAISLWEVAMLVAKGRLGLDSPVESWLVDALLVEGVELLPVTPAIAGLSSTLRMHADPADRMIVATAIVHQAPLITADGSIRGAKVVRCVW